MADTPKEDPDQALLTAARRGGLDAFETLVKRHETVVYNLVRTLVGNRADVEDIAQEAFVRAYRFLEQFRGDSTFRTWLFRVAVNATRSYHRRRTRQQKVWGDSGEGRAASLSEQLLGNLRDQVEGRFEGLAGLIRMFRVLNETPVARLESELSPLFDIDGALKFLAIEMALVNSDGYWTRASDYNIYQDPGGKFHVIPHDMNESPVERRRTWTPHAPRKSTSG